MQQYTWFYSLKTPLTLEQKQALEQSIDAFLTQWRSHGVPVEGMVRIAYDRFLIVQSDPADNRPSGCSIDSLKRAMTQMLAQHHMEVMDAAHVFYRTETAIDFSHFKELPKLIASGELTADQVVFDHSLGQSDDLDRWEVPLRETWLKRYLIQA